MTSKDSWVIVENKTHAHQPWTLTNKDNLISDDLVIQENWKITIKKLIDKLKINVDNVEILGKDRLKFSVVHPFLGWTKWKKLIAVIQLYRAVKRMETSV